MNQSALDSLAGSVTRAGLSGRAESELMAGFCRRIVDAGVPAPRSRPIFSTRCTRSMRVASSPARRPAG